MTIRNQIRTAVCEGNSLALLCQELSGELARLIAEPAATTGWQRARLILAALPLTTEEYGICVNRLTSADLYTSRRELGAAKFELTQLTRKLASLARVYGAHLIPANIDGCFGGG